MEEIIIYLYESNGNLIDNLISWRLESNWVHAAIGVDGYIYSSTFPVTLALPPSNKDVAMPPRTGSQWSLKITTEQKEKLKLYLDGRIGTPYDVLSMLGWLFRIKSLQVKNLTYCFEMVYDALFAAGIVPDRNKKFITGDQLENFVLKLDGTQIMSNAVNLKKKINLMTIIRK